MRCASSLQDDKVAEEIAEERWIGVPVRLGRESHAITREQRSMRTRSARRRSAAIPRIHFGNHSSRIHITIIPVCGADQPNPSLTSHRASWIQPVSLARTPQPITSRDHVTCSAASERKDAPVNAC